MGLLNPCTEFLIREHAARPLGPKVLFIGRQTVPMSLETLNKLLKKYGLQNQAPDTVEYDEETRQAQGHNYITDRYLMKALGVEVFHTLDVTDYEGADLIFDLGYPIPEAYHHSYDFIYNGSCFDNMFNPGVGLINLSTLLNKGGRILCIECASSWGSPYVMFSPGWFYDFFVTNKYESCATYLISYKNNEQLFFGPWKLYYANVPANPDGPPPEPHKGTHFANLVIAQKSEFSTDSAQPIQAQYRTTSELKKDYEEKAIAVRRSASKFLHGFQLDCDNAPYLTEIGHLGLDLLPDGVNVSDHNETAFERVIGALRSKRVAETLSSVIRIAKPLASRNSVAKKVVDRLDRSNDYIWSEINREIYF